MIRGCKSFLLMVLFFGPCIAMSKAVQFKSQKIHIQGVVLEVKVADSKIKREHGLMFQEVLKENEGMLFIFEEEGIHRFWNKNTFVDLSLGYFNSQKELIEILDLPKQKSIMSQSYVFLQNKRPALYVLEVKQGWFAKNQIKLGTKFNQL